ncbi:glycosyltransferase family 2 protein [Amycolatopsis jejuensis]|uniref:glycosyltransferase family 2 protein n=1 Tax=Amycolatopsis jejuensis TaxID=330084 RepID=UPI00052555DA|nr:glycosyltransferase family 2 protein [Amycolatopsis jejuensis]
MSAPELSVLMVTYNAAAHAERTLRALTGAAAPSMPFEVVVSDNGSTDGVADIVDSLAGPGTVKRLGRNTGFAYGVNRAAERATGRYLLLLNPDAEPKPGAIDALVAHLKANPSDGIVGGRTLDVTGQLEPRSCFGRITPWSLTCSALGLSAVFRGSRLFDPESLGQWARNSVRHVDIVSGGLMLMTRELWDRLGGLDEAFHIYGEDQDLCLRARELGCRPSITPRCEVVHDVGASSRGDVSGRDVLVLTGRAGVIQRHLGSWRGYGLFALRSGIALRAVAERLLRQGPRWTKVWQRRVEWEAGWPGTRVLV